MQKIGDLIKEYREKREIDRTTLSERIGVSVAYVSMIESNRRRGSDEVLQKIFTELAIPSERVTSILNAEEELANTVSEHDVSYNAKDFIGDVQPRKNFNRRESNITISTDNFDILLDVKVRFKDEFKKSVRQTTNNDINLPMRIRHILGLSVEKSLMKVLDSKRFNDDLCSYLDKEIDEFKERLVMQIELLDKLKSENND